MTNLSQTEKAQIMVETAQLLINMISNRMNNRVEILNTLSSSPMDTSVPDDVKKLREHEASKIRAVLQEQKDLVEIIKVLFPPVKPAKAEKPKKKDGRKDNLRQQD